MPEAIVSEAAKLLLTQGVLGLVVFGLVAVTIYQARQINSLRDQCDREQRESFEKRIEEFGKLLALMERVTNALASVEASRQALLTSINELARLVAALSQSSESSREYFKDVALRLEKALQDVLTSTRGR